LAPGKYVVKVVGADGVKLDTPEFTMNANGKVAVRVTVEGNAGPKKKVDPPVVAANVDRLAAEFVISLGNPVHIRVGGEERSIAQLADLPKEPFVLTAVFLPHSIVTDADLAKFRDCKHLNIIDLFDTKVTDAGMVNLKGKNLTQLQLGQTQVSDMGLANFK